MTPKTQEPLQFDNSCGCLVDYDLLSKAIFWYENRIIFKKRKIYLHAKYPAISLYDKKIHIHRLLLMYINRNIILNNMIGHHKNNNKLDCSLDNLELMTSKLHGSHHNKGKILSEEHKKKLSTAGRLRKGMKVNSKYKVFKLDICKSYKNGMSINKIANIYNCDWSTIKNIIHQNPELLETK